MNTSIRQNIMSIARNVPNTCKKIVVNLPKYTRDSLKTVSTFITFFTILLLVVVASLFRTMYAIPVLGTFVARAFRPLSSKTGAAYQYIFDKLEKARPFKIKRNYLIYIAYQNLLIRKSRSFITILGMSVGVGIIVLLLSLGYGIEKLVINQVATLDELQIVDISPGESSTASLDKETIKRMQKIAGIENILPLITVVGRLDYKNAVTDIVVHAVDPEYFQASPKSLIQGRYLSSSDVQAPKERVRGVVAGESTQLPNVKSGTQVNGKPLSVKPLPENQEVPIWKNCTLEAELLGNTTRTEGYYDGIEYWGEVYAPFEKYGRAGFDKSNRVYLGIWIMGEFPLYEKDVEGNLVPELVNSLPRWEKGCIPKKYLQTIEQPQFSGTVLGEATTSAVLEASAEADIDETISEFSQANISTNEAGLEVVTLQRDQQTEKKEEVLVFTQQLSKKAIMSSGLVNLLDLPKASVTKESFNISFIIIKSLMPKINGKILTSEAEYNVLGVIDDDENQYIYIPISDLESLGIENYSQIKIVLNDKANMADVRKQIETMGFKTSSTADTVSEIEGFFSSLRAVLGVLGFIALGVASLGMFNTLTVSLLERTREIGGMKTMGMVSGEIQELFLAEAMIMGFGGGIGGLFLGYTVGKLISYGISIISIAQGVGYLELTYIPAHLVIFILACSFVVGVVTGWYPAHRAKKISALNALRYE